MCIILTSTVLLFVHVYLFVSECATVYIYNARFLQSWEMLAGIANQILELDIINIT